MPSSAVQKRDHGANAELVRLKQANAAVSDALRSLEEMASLDIGLASRPADVCQVFVGKIRDTVDIRHLGVFLMNQETLEFDLALSLPAFREDRVREEFERQLAEDVIGWSVRERRLVVVPPLTACQDSDDEESVIIFPISTPRQVWGLVLCFSPHSCENQSQNTLRLLNIVANHIGMAVENASLMQSLSEQNKNLEKIVEKRSAEVIAKKEQLEEAYEELRRLDAAKDDFLSLVGHELRTPLTSVLSFSEFLAEEGISPEEVKEFATSIHREAVRLHDLVNDVLDLAKMEAGKLSYDYTEGNLEGVAELCISIMAAVAKKRDITIRFEKDENLPALCFAYDRIQQVILNLLSNAIKFSNDRGEVIVSVRDQGDSVCLSVRDFGVGIAARDISKVFNKFEQIEAVKHHSKGTGFGMPISKNIVEAGHNGNLWVNSDGRGKGATFFFTLPKRSPALGEQQPRDVKPAPSTLEKPRK